MGEATRNQIEILDHKLGMASSGDQQNWFTFMNLIDYKKFTDITIAILIKSSIWLSMDNHQYWFGGL